MEFHRGQNSKRVWGWGLAMTIAVALALAAISSKGETSERNPATQSGCSSEHTFHDITFCLPHSSENQR